MIELRNVTKTYEGGFTALEDVSLQISDGEFVFIVGGSGSGKTTLARLLIAEDKPTSGTISVDGWELSTLKRGKTPYYRRKLGIVFRDFRLFSEKTVYENVAFALRVIGEPSSSIRMKVNAALRMVELSDKGKCYPGELSGSEQQRVALARALANSPGVIVADEPTGNVDPVQSRELMELFCRIQSRYQKTVVVLTHDRELAESFGRRVVLLQRGKIVEDIPAYALEEEILAEMMQVSASEDEEMSSPEDNSTASDVDNDLVEMDPLVSEGAPEAANAEPYADNIGLVPEDAWAEESAEADVGSEQSESGSEEAPAEETAVAEEVGEDTAVSDLSAEEELPAIEAIAAAPPVSEEDSDQIAEAAEEAVSDETVGFETEVLPEIESDDAQAVEYEADAVPEETDSAAVTEKTQIFANVSSSAESVSDTDVISMTISTDTLESVLADILNDMTVEKTEKTEEVPSEATEEQGEEEQA